LLLGAVNAFNDEIGNARNLLSKNIENCAHIARQYKKENLPWVIIGDNNYGEGSSREHAAMTPRFLGCVAVITKGFARIHETNLKKQGLLALTFSNPMDYEKILEDDKISLKGLSNFSEKKPIHCIIAHIDGTSEDILLNHSYNNSQIEWFKTGSAMNVLSNKKYS
jgi:aconitate hydratase